MDLRYSIPLLVLILIATISLPFVFASNSVMQKMPVSYPPVVAAYQGRKIAASFGRMSA